MDICQIKAIDTHSHFNHGVLHEPATTPEHIRELNYLIQMNTAANIEISMYSTFSSVLHPELVVEENAYMFEFVQEYDWMYQWVVIDPRNPATYRQASKMLNHGKCVGIKLHPGSHKYDFTEFGDEIFSFAAEYGAIVKIHPMTSCIEFVPFADKYPDVTFILAHLSGPDFANAINMAKHRNIYTDTSSSSSSLNHTVEYTVEQGCSDRILFGTDTYAAGFQRGRIEYALISEEDKANILRNNAMRLFGRFL